jgi:HK97 family phage major capsid protein
MDQIRHIITQLQVGNLTGPGFIVVNPIDWADIETAKDSLGRYLVGDPRSSLAPNLWGVRVVPTNNISSGTFLAGKSGEAQIRDRMDAVVEVSTEHSDYFTRNMVAVRAEERLTLVVFRPTAFITGSFSNSPA